ncbi:MAG: NUDIX hydrolase [Deltaproteobacteria bacterium]|nr:NUDIX hydrolase [Deltaproteobacteria bacterium]
MPKKVPSPPKRPKAGASSASREEQAFLAAYRAQVYPRPAVTVDLAIFTLLDADLKLLLIRRKEHPFRGRWALPGGFVRVGDTFDDQGEDLDAAARRELAEETGLPAERLFLEQLHTFGRAGRDPRTRVISVAYTALIRPDLAPFVHAGSDAAEAGWCSTGEIAARALAFDHDEIVALALARLRERVEHGDAAFELVPPAFSVAELRAVHEAIKGTAYDPGNFRRRFLRLLEDGTIEEAPGKRVTGARPAKVYRFRRTAGASGPYALPGDRGYNGGLD